MRAAPRRAHSRSRFELTGKLGEVQEITIYADWRLGSPVEDALLVQVAESWDQADESFCPGRGTDADDVLRLVFVIEGELGEPAANVAKSKVEQIAARLGLPGRLQRISGCTEEEWFEWRSDE